MTLEFFLNRLPFRRREEPGPSDRGADLGGPRKWLPVIDTDSCSGCGMCLQACEHGCLDMVWSFATLLQPQDCGSEGHCMDACPENVIAMDWVALQRGREQGRWDDGLRETGEQDRTEAGFGDCSGSRP